MLGDHLGSSSVTTDANGVKTATALYKAFGETRYTLGNLGTDYKFTGQRLQAELGIYWFQSRWMDPSLGRFTSPDTIVPTSTQGTQAWDRYAFVNNNPVRYNDPTGHFAALAIPLIVISPAVLTVIGVVAVVAAGIAVGILVGMAIDSYVSKNTENKTNDLINSFGRNGDSGGWNLCPNPYACTIGAGFLAALLYEALTDGGCGEDESNCVKPVSTPTGSTTQQPFGPPAPTPTSTPTTTSTPTSTSTLTPTSTPSPTPAPTSMPTYHRYGEQIAY